MDYKFNTLWVYEMCYKYPFLYSKKKISKKIISDCMFSSYLSSYFIHFAGNWSESSFLEYSCKFNYKKKFFLIELDKYLKKKIKPKIRKSKLILK